MSSANGYGWKKRQLITLPCPSGQKVIVRRPGPEFTLRSGRVARTFTKALTVNAEPNAPKDANDLAAMQEYGLEIIAKMSDEDLAALMLFARDLVVTMVVSPRIVLNPREDSDEIGPEDIGNDFWFLFAYGMKNFMDLKVPVGTGDMESEVEVSDLSTFRAESGVSGHGVDGLHIPVAESERAVDDPRLVDGAGV